MSVSVNGLAKSVWGVFALLFAAMHTAACTSDDVENYQTQALGTIAFRIDTSVLRPAEDLVLAISTEFSAFAGYYCAKGDLWVGVVGGTSAPDAQEIQDRIEAEGIASSCRSRTFGEREPNIRLVEATTSFLTLRAWRDSIANHVFDQTWVHGLGIDYQANRIVLSVDFGAKEEGVGLLTSYGLPAEGFDVVESERPRPTLACPAAPYNGTYLRNCFRPIPGGVQISMGNQGGTTGYGACTMTLGVKRSGLDGWITAEHCVPPIGAANLDYVYQPNFDSAQYTAVEYVNPSGWTCGSYHCKYSDSAFLLKYVYGGGVDKGAIAQTLYWNGYLGVCDGTPGAACLLNSSYPRFFVQSYRAPVQGATVEKVGRTTGWTTGSITATCTDLLDGLGGKLVCNGKASLTVEGGDSGSPVFYWMSGTNTDVDMIGVLWGKNGSEGLFSPWANVVTDLGSLDIAH